MGVFIYSVLSYLIGVAFLFYFFGFVGGYDFIPRHIDSGEPGAPLLAALVNFCLVLLFALHHSIAARAGFKPWLRRYIPPAAERSTYVLASGVLIGLICLFWQPLPGSLWTVENSSISSLLILFQLAGWIITVLSSFLINHFELFGLQQAWLHLLGKEPAAPSFTDRLFYKVVRHPLQFGLLLGLWSTPYMSTTHFMLSATMTCYIYIGLYFEEKDLAATLGAPYMEYQQRVRKLLPIPKKNAGSKE